MAGRTDRHAAGLCRTGWAALAIVWAVALLRKTTVTPVTIAIYAFAVLATVLELVISGWMRMDS